MREAGHVGPAHLQLVADHQEPAPGLAGALARLQKLRRALDHWNLAEGRYQMPQPSDFGINLTSAKPSDVLWRAAS